MNLPAGILRAIEVRRDERPVLLLSALMAMLAVAEAVLIRSFSDAVFLDRFSVDWLSLFYLASALVFVPATLAYGGLTRRLNKHKLHLGCLLLFAAGTLVSYFTPRTPTLTFAVVLCLAVISPLVNVVVWSGILSRLDSRQARRLVPLISAGATFGGIAAGLLALPLIRWVGVAELLLPVAAINLALALLLLVRRRTPGAGTPPPRSASSPGGAGAQASPSGPWLPGAPGVAAAAGERAGRRLVALLAGAVLLMSLCTNLADFAFKSELQTRFGGAQTQPLRWPGQTQAEPRVVSGPLAPRPAAGIPTAPSEEPETKRPGLQRLGLALSAFNAVTNLLILLAQLLVVSRLVRRLGLQASFALHPLAVLGGLALFQLVPGLAMVALWKLSDTLFKFSFHGPTLEMALTPLPAAFRDRARALIKGVMHPLGGFVAGLLLLALGGLGLSPRWLVLPGTLLAALAWAAMSLRLRGRYLHALRAALGAPAGRQSGGSPEPGAVHPAEAPAPGRSGPGLDGSRSRSGALRAVHGAVATLQQVGRLAGEDDGAHRRAGAEASDGETPEVQQALEQLFAALAQLGDPATVDLVSRRYCQGGLRTKAIALELLETHLDERRVTEAVALLERLAPRLVERAAAQRRRAESERQGRTISGRLSRLLTPLPWSGEGD